MHVAIKATKNTTLRMIPPDLWGPSGAPLKTRTTTRQELV